MRRRARRGRRLGLLGKTAKHKSKKKPNDDEMFACSHVFLLRPISLKAAGRPEQAAAGPGQVRGKSFLLFRSRRLPDHQITQSWGYPPPPGHPNKQSAKLQT